MFIGHGNKNGVVITSSRSTTNNGPNQKSHFTNIASNNNKNIDSKTEIGKESAENPFLEATSSNKSTDINITKVNINNTDLLSEPVRYKKCISKTQLRILTGRNG